MGSFRSPLKGRALVFGRALFAVAVALSLSGNVFAQAQTVWSQLAFGAGGNNLKWTDVVVLPSGKVAACGEEDTANGKDLVIQAWEPDGDVAWIYRYPDPLDETLEFSGKLAVRGNNLLFAGHRYFNATATDTNIYLVELTDSGAQVHIHNYSIDFQSMSDVEQDITVVGTDAYITGRNVGSINDSYFVLKVDASNSISWIYNPGAIDTVLPLPAKALPNGFIVCGYESGFGIRQTQLKVLNPSTGSVAYSHIPSTPTSDKADFDVTNQNGIVMTYRHSNGGTTRIEQLDDHLVSLGGTDIVGTMSQLHIAYSPVDQCIYHLRYNYPNNEILIRRYNAGGVFAWEDSVPNTISSPDRFSLAIDRYGNPVAFGSRDNGGALDLRGCCWSANGVRQWSNTLNSNNSNETGAAVAIDGGLRFFGVGQAKNVAGNLSKGAIWRTSQYFWATPSAMSIVAGQPLSGDLTSLQSDDNAPLTLRRRLDRNALVGPIVLEFSATFPIGDARPGETALNLRVKSRSNNWRTLQSIQLWNYQTNAWGDISLNKLSPNYATIDLSITNLAAYMHPTSRQVKARLLVNPGPNGSSNQSVADVDYVEWSCTL